MTPEELRRAPKVLLHDHLDGGLRPATLVELADASGYRGLPTGDPDELAHWFTDRCARGSLGHYLEAFAHTVAVMQTAGHLRRVARECVEDLAGDGVVYAEVRFAPELHTSAGLRPAQVVEAVLEGFAEGMSSARRAARPVVVRALLAAVRSEGRAMETAELAVRYRDAGVVGFDLAGLERGHPPTRHAAAFTYVHRANLPATVHAGEGAGLWSLWQAVSCCHAERIGHGVRLAEDIQGRPDGSARLGRLAAYVRDRGLALEMCPTSNLHTGAVASLAAHPVDLLLQLGFRVTVNTDNRLMSGVTLTSELAGCARLFGWGWGQLHRLAVNAMESAFCHFDERRLLLDSVVNPGYEALAGTGSGG